MHKKELVGLKNKLSSFQQAILRGNPVQEDNEEVETIQNVIDIIDSYIK